MTDSQLHQLMINLVESIRQIPSGEVHLTVANRCIAVIAHLERAGHIDKGQWHLSSRHDQG